MNSRNSDDAQVDTIQRVNGSWRSTRITRRELCASATGLSDIVIAFLSTEAALPLPHKIANNDLSSHFKIPPSFWTSVAQAASGFFGVQDNRAANRDLISYTSFFRFLIKETSPEQNTTVDKKASYNWHKAGFFTSWQCRNASVILCFDLPRFLQESISKSIMSSGTAIRAEDLFAVHAIIVGEIVVLYDRAVWSMRDLVRGFEQNRVSPLDYDPQPNYAEVHEMARHVIHSTEMLEMALEVVAGMIREHEQFFNDHPSALVHYKRAGNELRYQSTILKCIHLRSKALKERLNNEINLAINVVAQHDSHLSVLISEATQADNAAVKTISILGLTFLPGTFVCAVFSTSFFNFSPATSTGAQHWVLSNKFWVYWAVAIPVTVLVFVCWFAWQRREASRQQKLYAKRFAAGLPKYSK